MDHPARRAAAVACRAAAVACRADGSLPTARPANRAITGYGRQGCGGRSARQAPVRQFPGRTAHRCTSDSEVRARRLLAGMRAALGSVGTADNSLYARAVSQSRLRRALASAQAPFLFPMQLSVEELERSWPGRSARRMSLACRGAAAGTCRQAARSPGAAWSSQGRTFRVRNGPWR